jgi:hypothetical protein
MQIALRDILWSVFWVSVALAAWVANLSPLKGQSGEVLLFTVYAIRIAAPCAAIGALRGRALLGFGIGCGLFVVMIIAFLFAIGISGRAMSV